MKKRARFVINPEVLLQNILPAGNQITGVAVTPDGYLLFEFAGIDVPDGLGHDGRAELQPTPMMVLMGSRTSGGDYSYWFESAPVPRVRRTRAKRVAVSP